jgi:Flp pilus assembly protein TadD
MAASIDQLRAQLRRSPADWGVRLELAEALVREGSGQQAAVLISTAPKDPPDIDSVLRAALLVMKLDPKLAMRFTDRALAQDESNVEAALVRARILQHRNEPEEAHRFATVAAALDANRCARETALMSWLAAEGLAIDAHADFSKPIQAEAEPEAVRPVAVVQEPEEEAVAAVLMEEEAEPVLALIAEESPPEITAIPIEEPVLQPVAVVEPRKAEAATSKDEESQVAIVVLEPETEEAKAVPVTEADVLPPIITPKSNAHTIHKASAITLALVIHAILVLLLGLLVVIVPEPPVAELVGIVTPETAQEQPQTKQITPTAMPTPTAVAAAPSRAITAAGISSISLPDFESKSDGPIAMDIATTDLGASFAMPFSPKGTSQVNFFGIKSQGRRVAFLIDVERYMLTDPRGGYPAYEIVKNEIAGMIGKLGLETYFNVILYEGSAVSAYSDKLLPATTSNKDKIRDWLYPVNRDFEKLGLRPIGYPVQTVSSEVEPVEAQHLSGYLRAIQFALETDVDAVFIICSGYRSMTIPRKKEDREELLKKMRWTEKDSQAWQEAIKKGQDWLAKENAARKAKGIPQRVIVNIGEVWRDMGLRPPRNPPGDIQITTEQREDQVKNAIRLHYQAKGKPKPQINFVIFIGKDQDKEKVPQLEHFENISQRARSGKVRVLQGLAALKNVSGK